MARIEWIKHRLNNWALWKVRESSGGLGFSSQAVFLHEVVDQSRESAVPVDDTDGELTNQAVESLKLTRSHLYLTLQLIYIKGLGIKGTAAKMCRAESTIKAQLDQADKALAEWFTDHTEAQRIARATYLQNVKRSSTP